MKAHTEKSGGALRSGVLKRVYEAYRGAPPQHRHYVRFKLKTDPFTSELLDLAETLGPFGLTVDAGCGRGQYTLLLAEAGAISGAVGFDHDSAKVKAASEAARAVQGGLVRFHEGDVRTQPFPRCDTLLLVDVLHYLSAEEQRTVLARAASSLNSGGRLIIRETSAGTSFGSRLAASLEHVGRAVGINRGTQLEFLSPERTSDTLKDLGLFVTRHSPRGVLKNVLIVAQKSASDLG